LSIVKLFRKRQPIAAFLPDFTGIIGAGFWDIDGFDEFGTGEFATTS
jgi:predicted AlkP superfamily pyrophosphatase or phosphodiesterase